MGKEELKVGLLGAGTIGGGVISLFNKNRERLREQTGVKLSLARVADQNLSRLRALGIPGECLSNDATEVIDDPSIAILIELIGGIDPARSLIQRALENGKYVVTANKDLMAAHGEELLTLARKRGRNIFYEASVGGGIPLIRPLKYSLVADRIKRIVGIVNGTTNYIFTRMTDDNLKLEEALREAQKLGFAEADPSSDIEGRDAAYKLVIMAGLAFGKKVNFGQVFVQGVNGVTREDILYAREIGHTVKLLAIAEELPEGLGLRVHPTLVPLDHPIASVSNEFNAVFVEGEAVGEIMFYGKGAGAMPTATAVMADVAEAARCILYGHNSGATERITAEARCVSIKKLSSCFYLRFLADDRPGVFAALANVFGDEKVSLDMVIQKRRVADAAEIVLVTHRVKEEAFQKALNRVMAIPAIKPDPSMIRLLG